MPTFKPQELSQAQAFWKAGERYSVKPVGDARTGGYQVRLTPEGSMWLWALDRKRGLAKGQTPVELPEDQDWDAWIRTKIEFDRWQAQLSANKLNASGGFAATELDDAPAAPGPIPESLRLLVGDAPLLANAVQPRLHVVNFGNGETYELQDHPNLPKNWTFYRYAEGVRHFGRKVKEMSESEIGPLFQAAGITAAQRRIFQSVSLLEGGFDSINTYDTGYVSVGFIQFACLGKGAGSLGAVLQRYQQNDAAGFARDFRQYGISVAPDGSLVALNLDSGETLTGYDAARRIMADKRLAAVFHRAGQKSDGFRVAQLQVARDQYYPANDAVTLTLKGQSVETKVSSFVKSEAGLATLMDRKVHTGGLGRLVAVANEVAATNGVTTTDELAAFESEIIKRIQHRKNYMADASLSQPVARESRRDRSRRN